MLIFKDDEQHQALVDYIESIAAIIGTKVEIHRTVTIHTEDARIVAEIERLRSSRLSLRGETREVML